LVDISIPITANGTSSVDYLSSCRRYFSVDMK
jgi:hypothetical protein